MRTRFTDAFGIRYPIVCAPMALVTGGRLAAAVSDAGGFGILGGGYAGVLGGEPDLAEELAHLRGHNCGVGFITWALTRAPHLLELALSHAPACVFLSFGDPQPFAAAVHRRGAKLVCQVQSLRHVDQALDAGAAVIVAQGAEAGGHGATRATMPFVPEVADYLAKRAPETLLLAAGGIADGRGLAAALMLGADGAVVGTRFWSAAEALTPAAMTSRGAEVTGDDTVRTKTVNRLRGVPWPDEFSFRVLRNTISDEWAAKDPATIPFGSLAQTYADARARQDLDVLPIVAGESIGLVTDRPPAATIVERMMREAKGVMRTWGDRAALTSD